MTTLTSFRIKTAGLSLFIILVLGPACAVCQQRVPTSYPCERVQLSETLSWIFSVDWALGGGPDRILGIQSSDGRLYQIGLDGTVSEKSPVATPLDRVNRISAIQRLPHSKRYIIENEGAWSSTFLVTDAEFVVIAEYTGTGRLDAVGRELKIIWSWVLDESQSRIVAFADLQDGSEFKSAFVTFFLAGNAFSVVGEEFELHSSMRTLNRLRYQYAVPGPEFSIIYLAMSDDEVTLYSIKTDFKTHKNVPYRTLPLSNLHAVRMPVLYGPTSLARVFAALTDQDFVSGIYIWEDRLFVLTLSNTPFGDTMKRWSLIEIDPDTGEEIAKFLLPSRAPHLMVVPGDRHWAIIEKGPVFEKPSRDQYVNFFWLIPAELMRNPQIVRSASPEYECPWEKR